jgi:acyl-CoA hydrolase
MEVEVSVHSEEPDTGVRHLTTTALVTMVAVDASGRPRRIPPLATRTDEEQRRQEAAAERRRARLEARAET